MKLSLLIALLAPVLGSPDYVGSYGVGWGTVAPPRISNGGTPNGSVDHIRWSGWGGSVARGSGRTYIYRPGGGYYPGSVRAQLRVSRLGTCPGRSERAYRRLEVRSPSWPGGPLGPWYPWSRTMCKDSANSGTLPGYCGLVGKSNAPRTFQSIEVVRLSCSTARRAALRVRDASCSRGGCTLRVNAGLRCRLERVREIDRLDINRPVQRLYCRGAAGSLTGFYVR